MACERERREAGLADDDSQFLLQLPDQALFRTLMRLDLAAGKFPQAGHRPARRALSDQHAPIGIDESTCSDEDEFDAQDPASQGWQVNVKVG